MTARLWVEYQWELLRALARLWKKSVLAPKVYPLRKGDTLLLTYELTFDI